MRRFVLLALLVAAPVAALAPPAAADGNVCTPVGPCVSWFTLKNGAGSCDEGAYYSQYQAVGVNSRDTPAGSYHAGLSNGCARYERYQHELRHMFLQVRGVTPAGLVMVQYVWYEQPSGGRYECREFVTVDAPVVGHARHDIGCNSPPPVLPTVLP